MGGVELGGGQHLVRPSALRHIEPKRAGGVRHLAHELARKAMPEPVLRQQDLARGGEQGRFVTAHPNELRCREAGHGAVASAREDFGVFLHPLAFGVCAPVVPQDGGAQHFVAFVHEHRAVHLAGQANGIHAWKMVSQLPQRTFERLPPMLWVLLAHLRAGARDIEWRVCFGHDFLVHIARPGTRNGHHRLHGGGAEIDAKLHRV